MSTVHGALDEPSANTIVSGSVTFRGWALSRPESTLHAEVVVDDRVLASLPFGIQRDDVRAVHPHPSSEPCGFEGTVPLEGLHSGEHVFVVRVRDDRNAEWRTSAKLTVLPNVVPRIQSGKAVRAIAFFLPQYHPIPENDAWWGAGFTEWTNVVRARPQFEEHEQPQLPTDLGFYDLRVPEIREQQATLARQNGVFGFCYYYYWFGGRRLLERPLDDVARLGTPDLPFCICWANENWTRRWDGAENEILMAQHHSPADDEALMHSVLGLFADPRYICVGDRPMFLVYRPAILPDAAATTERWRRVCSNAGVPDPYLVAVQSFGLGDPRPYGFDAAVEFPPHSIHAVEITHRVRGLSREFNGHVYDYADLANHAMRRPAQDYTLFRGVMPAWDNTARKKSAAHIYFGSTPAIYERWLSVAAARAQDELPADRRFIFINAWNEWGEGCHLEPDDRHGHTYLRATRNVVARTSHGDADPLVSVILPTYNRAESLAEALASVIAQTYAPIELIVVNDGSTDGTIRAVAEFRARHPQSSISLLTRANGGAHAAINDGLRAATGAYVAILNDDDRFTPDRVVRMVKALQASGARFAFSLCQYIDADGMPVSSSHAQASTFRAKQFAIQEFPTIGYALLDYNVTISTGNFFMERSLFEDVGEFAPLRYCHDWDFVLRSLRFGDPMVVERELYEYRFHGSNQFSALQDIAETETRDVLTRFFSESATLRNLPSSYPVETNFPGYHERFIAEHGYEQYLPGGAQRQSARQVAHR